MGASLSGVFSLQEFTDLGLLAAGYRLYTYAPATTTLKVAYTDAAGTIPHTYTSDGLGGQYIALNSRGELPAPLFLLPGGYDITLKTALGVTVWTRRAIGEDDAALLALASLADKTDAGKGAGQIGWNPNLPYVAGTAGEALRDGEINMLWFVTDEAARQDIITGTGAVDVGAYMDAATAFASANKKSLFMPDGMWKRTTSWVVPVKVGVRAENRGQAPHNVLDPASQYGQGATIYIAASVPAVIRTGAVSYDESSPITGVCVQSHRANFPGSQGFVLDMVAHATLHQCSVYGVGGDAFVIGVTAGDVTGQNVLTDNYVNNCGGKAYNLRSKWTRGWGNKSDGCTHHLYMNNAPETNWESWHGEGWTSMGVQMSGINTSSRMTGKGFCANTNPTPGIYGIKIDDVAGNNDITIDGVKIQGSSVVGVITFTGALAAATSGTLTAAFAGTTGSYALLFSDGSKRTATLTNGSTAVNWTGAVTATAAVNTMTNPSFVGIEVGSQALTTRVTKCEFNQCPVGVNDNASVATRIVDNDFFQGGINISCNSGSTRYELNKFDTTLGIDIDHVGGNTGIWTGNAFSKGIKPTATGVAGNFGTNLVYANKGLRTKAGGTTSGSIASGTSIAHGLSASAIPARFVGIPTSPATYTNFRLGTADGTNIQFLWDGGGNLQIQWEAVATCEVQT